VIALKIPAVVEAVEGEEAKVEVENVTNVVNPGIWLVHALILLVMEEGGTTLHLVVAMVRRRLGKYFLLYRPVFFWLIICLN
jgi:hypothetical protein